MAPLHTIFSTTLSLLLLLTVLLVVLPNLGAHTFVEPATVYDIAVQGKVTGEKITFTPLLDEHTLIGVSEQTVAYGGEFKVVVQPNNTGREAMKFQETYAGTHLTFNITGMKEKGFSIIVHQKVGGSFQPLNTIVVSGDNCLDKKMNINSELKRFTLAESTSTLSYEPSSTVVYRFEGSVEVTGRRIR